MNIHKSRAAIISLAIILLLLVSFALFYVNKNLSHPFFVLTMGFMAFILLYVVTIAQMVRSGRSKAKGAKKRRRQLLPILYRKKPKKSYGRSPKQGKINSFK
ncbi:hypothetical protein GXP67_08690 [Rhodocytophaga rosea]|uniref:Uncharacterized protein n=1 Tax=Rhodocytophaga rosea TaxID=2704465 RepID=A0A6C0GFD4_9BACT|nr:hypothetical protein [Rhodocytophaga rosea]QHT66731.1 hypothetical protein GXP67_08690 [Rhodocytophaga rosea]